MIRSAKTAAMAVIFAAVLAGCSTGTVDRQLFAHTEDTTYARVRAAVPVGTPLQVAEATMKGMGWICYVGRSNVVPNDTKQRVGGKTLSCDAYPAFGGYPLSKEYYATFLILDGSVGVLQVGITDPTV